MQQISSISEFLLQAGTQYRVYDLGRTIRPLDSQQALAIENGSEVAPYPRQNLVWLGLVFWNNTASEQHYLWFIKLPLDENGCVITAHRDQFLATIVEALGNNFISDSEGSKELPENPYCFQPTQQQMADFNAIVKYQLGLQSSEKSALCQTYLANPGIVDWQLLPLQALADIACRIDQTEIASSIVTNIKLYPRPVLFALCASFENQILTTQTTAALSQWLLLEDDPSVRHHLLRAISNSQEKANLKSVISTLLNNIQYHADELFIVLAGRQWQLLADLDLIQTFLEKLAAYDSSKALFVAIYSDLVSIPMIRQKVLDVLRTPEKSVELQHAIGRLYTRGEQDND